MLEVQNLAVRYGHVEALRNVELTVAPGEIVSVLGANGAGKSTLLRAISGLIRPRRGQIVFDGHHIEAASSAGIVGLGLLHVLEGRGILTELTVLENLRIGAYRRRDKDAIRSDLERLLTIFPVLRSRLAQSAGLLSGGEQQMLAIARALIGKPRLVMIDEMSLGLAPLFVKAIFEVIQTIARTGTAFLLVEQNARLALRYSDRAYVLKQGQVALCGKSQEILFDADLLRSYLA